MVILTYTLLGTGLFLLSIAIIIMIVSYSLHLKYSGRESLTLHSKVGETHDFSYIEVNPLLLRKTGNFVFVTSLYLLSASLIVPTFVIVFSRVV